MTARVYYFKVLSWRIPGVVFYTCFTARCPHLRVAVLSCWLMCGHLQVKLHAIAAAGRLSTHNKRAHGSVVTAGTSVTDDPTSFVLHSLPLQPSQLTQARHDTLKFHVSGGPSLASGLGAGLGAEMEGLGDSSVGSSTSEWPGSQSVHSLSVRRGGVAV